MTEMFTLKADASVTILALSTLFNDLSVEGKDTGTSSWVLYSCMLGLKTIPIIINRLLQLYYSTC